MNPYFIAGFNAKLAELQVSAGLKELLLKHVHPAASVAAGGLAGGIAGNEIGGTPGHGLAGMGLGMLAGAPFTALHSKIQNQLQQREMRQKLEGIKQDMLNR